MLCIFFILDCDIAHILYTVKSKHFNVLFNSKKKIGFNRNIEIESQQFEFRNLNARGTNSGKKTNFMR